MKQVLSKITQKLKLDNLSSIKAHSSNIFNDKLMLKTFC